MVCSKILPADSEHWPLLFLILSDSVRTLMVTHTLFPLSTQQMVLQSFRHVRWDEKLSITLRVSQWMPRPSVGVHSMPMPVMRGYTRTPRGNQDVGCYSFLTWSNSFLSFKIQHTPLLFYGPFPVTHFWTRSPPHWPLNHILFCSTYVMLLTLIVLKLLFN